MTDIRLKLVEKTSDLKNLINNAIAARLNKLIPKILLPIKRRVETVITDLFENSDTYESISSGELQQHFGLRDSEVYEKLNTILDLMLKSLNVEFIPITYNAGRFRGGIKIYAIPKNFQDLFGDSSSEVVTDKGQSLPWLKWLLIEGDKIIINDYEIAFGPFPTSRAGDAIMVKQNGGIWRVPPEFAGTKNNNWLTKLFTQTNLAKNQITTIIVEEFNTLQ